MPAPRDPRDGTGPEGAASPSGRAAKIGNFLVAALLAILAFNLLWTWRSCESAGPAGAGKPAPEFALDAMDRSRVRLRELRGRVVALAFFATWCAPCIAELPVLERLAARYRGRGLTLLMIDVAEPREAIEALLRARPLALTVLRDTDGRTSERYGVESLPTLVLVDRDGVVRAREVGATGEHRMANRIEALLARPAGSGKP